MTIPKSYEALAADLASEKILSKTLIGQKEAYMMLADRGRLDLATWKQKACEAAEREAALREELRKWKETAWRHSQDRDEIQQRLTVAEQREVELEGLLREVASLDPRGEFLGWQLDGKIDAALKPAEEGEGS